MRSITSAALLAAAAFAMVQAPVEAAPRKRAEYQPPRYIYYGREDRAPTRITVRRRSFLDPGSEFEDVRAVLLQLFCVAVIHDLPELFRL